MRSSFGSIAVLSLAALSASAQGSTAAAPAIPHLQKQGTATQLVVDGKPFLMLAAELRNSSGSSLEYLKPIWPKLAAMHINTVLTAVYWELLEPKEGQFDFTLVDGAIQAAQENNLRLIFLWFGSWKNGVSSYPPAWVKTDQNRFPRVQEKNGKSMETLSTLGMASRDADSRAFAALMRHIKASGHPSHGDHDAGGERNRRPGRLAGQERSGEQGVRGACAQRTAGLYRQPQGQSAPGSRQGMGIGGVQDIRDLGRSLRQVPLHG